MCSIEKMLACVGARGFKKPKHLKFNQVMSFLKRNGYNLARITGDHHQFCSDTGDRISICCDGNVTRTGVVEDIIKRFAVGNDYRYGKRK